MKSLRSPRSVRNAAQSCVGFGFITAVLFVVTASLLPAQTAHFAGAQTAVGSGFTAPSGIAVDAGGNVYVADAAAGKVTRIPASDPTCATPSDCTSVGAGLVNPRSVALDASGNVYIADETANTVTKVLASDLSCSTAGDCTGVGPSLKNPEGVAVDSSGNVYIADTGNGRVLYVPVGDLTCAIPSDCKSVGTGLTTPVGVGVDRAKNVYIADTSKTTILKVLSTDLTCTTAGDCTAVGSGFSSPSDAAMNFNGDVFVADTGNNRIVKIPSSDLTCATASDCKTVGAGLNQPTAIALTQFANVYAADFGNARALEIQLGAANLGSVNVGSTSGAVTLTFTVDTAGSLSSSTAYQVETQGITGLDFKDAGGATCTTSAGFTAGQTCTVSVNLSPANAGRRLGAVQLYGAGGAVIATANLYGTGTGPHAAFFPGTQSTLLSPINGSAGVAVDAGGNIYVTSYSGGELYKVTQSGGVYSATAIGTGLNTPLGVAVDGAGNVFVASSGGIIEFTPSGSSYNASTVLAGADYLVGIAVDPFGTIYYTDLFAGAAFRLVPSNGTYTQYSLGGPYTGPYGIALDPNGNVFIADFDGHAFFKETRGTNGFYTQSTIYSVSSSTNPTTVAIDPSGTLYAAVLWGAITRLTPSGGSYTPTTVVSSTTPPVYGAALDGAGNLYFTYENPDPTDGLYEINVNGQPALSLNFANTAVGATSTDSPKGYGVWNTGNAPLILTTPGTGTNPSYPTDFPVNSSDAQLCSSASPLAAGATCDVSIDFTPQTSGSHSETVTITDNTLNGTNVQQSIAVSGTGSGASISISPTTLPADTYNTAITPVNFTASGGTGPYTYTVSSGSLPPGLTLASSGTFSGTPTSAGSYSFTVQAQDSASNTGSQAYSVTVNKATPTLSVTNSPVTYSGSAQAATVTSPVSGTVSNVQYGGSSTVPTSAGTYAITADFTPTDTNDYVALTAASAGNFVINQATPTLAVTNSPATYNGSAQAATVTSPVSGTVSNVQYGGSSTVPTAAGTYAITANFTPTDTTDYVSLTGASAGSFVINKATPTLSVSNPSVGYTGSAQSATVTGSISGTVSNVQYNGSSTAPTTVGSYTVTANFTPTDSTDYASLTGASAGTFAITKATPTIAWSTPAAITYGTALSSTQLDATSTVAGSFVYTPASGTVLAAGTQTLSVTLTPTDTTDYNNATQTVQITVGKATPAITWATPAAISYGTALSATQLDATSTVAGSFVYTPAAGTVLGAGTQTLSVTLTPTDTTDYTTATQTVQLVVSKSAPAITWPTPSAINYGTALSSTQLDATSTVAGSFVYTPASGTVLGAGTQTLSVTLTPTDTTDYTTATQTVQLVVNKAGAPTITWATPAAIAYGTALSATQLDATTTIPGSFAYTPAAGTVLQAGTQTLSVTFDPTDSTDYPPSTQTVQIVVNKATPTVTWATPAAITYGTALSATQLNATGSVPGAFAYTPAAGTVLTAGTQTLSVTFTPTDATDYASVTQTVQITVGKATPSITWSAPAAITYGTALSATQLDASSTIPGTFAYTPSSGAVLAAGTQTLSVTLTPNDAVDYNDATATVQITVNQGSAPTITWAAPSAITYGTALSATQLDATTTIPGTFAYTPASGTVLSAGVQTLSVTFTPTDTTDYPTATKTVQITVSQAAQTITFNPPASVAYGSASIALTATGGGSGNPVTFTLVSGPATLTGSTLTFTGVGTVVVDANQAGNSNYLAATQVAKSINVTNAVLTVAANNASRAYGAANPTFTGSVTGAVNGDTFTETFSTSAAAASPVGTYAIVPAVTGSNLAAYTVNTQNGTLTVTQALTATALVVSSSSINPGQSLTLTATVTSSTTGTPTGSVSFFDGSTLLGSGSLASGTASFSSTGLLSGSHSITAVYSGDTNFAGSSTTAATTITVAALDFTLKVSGASDESIKQGGDAYYQLALDPTFGNYPGTVTFAATGLPTGATVTFSPSNVAANAGQQSITATVVTAPAVGANVAPAIGRKLAPLGLALVLLPLAGARRMRRYGRGMSRWLSLLLLLGGLATAAAVSGCGSNISTKTQQSQSFTITITGTGGNAQHSVNVTLEIN